MREVRVLDRRALEATVRTLTLGDGKFGANESKDQRLQ